MKKKDANVGRVIISKRRGVEVCEAEHTGKMGNGGGRGWEMGNMYSVLISVF